MVKFVKNDVQNSRGSNHFRILLDFKNAVWQKQGPVVASFHKHCTGLQTESRHDLFEERVSCLFQNRVVVNNK